MTIKQKIWKILEEKGYVNDQELFNIYGKEEEINWATSGEYERQWRKLKRDREFFVDKKILALVKYRGCRAEIFGGWYRISPHYFEEIKVNFIKDNSRPDLTSEMYKLPTKKK
jgi:hypothetical protein